MKQRHCSMLCTFSFSDSMSYARKLKGRAIGMPKNSLKCSRGAGATVVSSSTTWCRPRLRVWNVGCNALVGFKRKQWHCASARQPARGVAWDIAHYERPNTSCHSLRLIAHSLAADVPRGFLDDVLFAVWWTLILASKLSGCSAQVANAIKQAVHAHKDNQEIQINNDMETMGQQSDRATRDGATNVHIQSCDLSQAHENDPFTSVHRFGEN